MGRLPRVLGVKDWGGGHVITRAHSPVCTVDYGAALQSSLHDRSTMIADTGIVRQAGIVLASSSPRRVEIINGILTLAASVVPSTFPEDLDKSKYSPTEYVIENARQKALEVSKRLNGPSLVIGADTVVIHNGRILEKPKSVEEAKATLGELSGVSHEVRSNDPKLIMASRRASARPCVCR